jgi:hypothetical protein
MERGRGPRLNIRFLNELTLFHRSVFRYRQVSALEKGFPVKSNIIPYSTFIIRYPTPICV